MFDVSHCSTVGHKLQLVIVSYGETLGDGLTPCDDDGVEHDDDGEGDEPTDEALHDGLNFGCGLALALVSMYLRHL